MEYLSHDDPLLALEQELWSEGFSFIAGVDEVGRGPLAGPVVAAAVVFPKNTPIPVVNDSKQLSESKRLAYRDAILSVPGVLYAIVEKTPGEIDEINILEASRQAMRDAVSQLNNTDFALIDGLPVPSFPVENRAIVKGDAKSASIAAASILAKVHRDAYMCELDDSYPGYGFSEHKGYGTKKHLAAIAELGVCPEHRRSFAPVRNIIDPPPEHPDLFAL